MHQTFDVIMVGDSPTYPNWSRSYGTHRLASHLRLHGFSVLVIDFCSAMDLQIWQSICDSAIGENTQLVGFSTTWLPYRTTFSSTNKLEVTLDPHNWISGHNNNDIFDRNSFTFHAATGNAKSWIDIVKEKNKKIKIVLGGSRLDHYLDFPADYFVSGLGENQLIDLLTQPKRIWPTIIKHDVNSNIRDWGWTSSTTSYTEHDQITPDEILSLEIARGCKFKCSFCSYPLIGQKDIAAYLKTEETLYHEVLDNYNAWGTTKYFVVDDTLNDSIEKLEMLVRINQQLPFDLQLHCYLRLDIIATQSRQLELIPASGIVSGLIGIESFHPVASKVSGKGMDSSRRKRTLYAMRDAWGDRVSLTGTFIVGLPGEDSVSLKSELAWLLKKDCPINNNASFTTLIINPPRPDSYIIGSELDKNPQAFGYETPDPNNPTHWTKDDGTDINSFFDARKLSDELNKQYGFIRSLRQKQYQGHVEYENVQKDPIKEYFGPLINMLNKNN